MTVGGPGPDEFGADDPDADDVGSDWGADVVDGEWPPSPVPADADLWPGERPFTAWGQHDVGVLDLRVFDQERWWVDIRQCPHELASLSADYVANVITFLELHAEQFHLDACCRAVVTRYGDDLLGRVNADAIAEALGAPPVGELTASEWLEATPLMRALRRLDGRRQG